MTACREFLELMSASLDQALSPEDQARLESHLAECAECSAAQTELEWVHSQLKGLGPVEPPPWLASKIMVKIRSEAAPRASFWHRFIRPVVMKPQLQVASVLLLAATGFYLLKSQRPGQDVFKESAPPQAPAPMQSQPQKSEAARDQLAPGSRNAPAESQKPALDRRDQVLLGDSSQSESGFAPPPKTAVAPPPPAPSSPAQLDFAKQEKDKGRPEPAASLDAPKPSPLAGAVVGGAAPVLAESAAPARQVQKSSKEVEGRAGNERGDRGNRSDEEFRQRAAETAGRLQPQAERKEKPDAVVWGIRLEMPDPASAKPLIERELARAGATLVPRREPDASRILRARLDPRRLPDLLSRLGRIGKVLEHPDLAGEKPSVVALSISW